MRKFNNSINDFNYSLRKFKNKTDALTHISKWMSKKEFKHFNIYMKVNYSPIRDEYEIEVIQR